MASTHYAVIRSGYGLSPDSTKQLLEPTLPYCQLPPDDKWSLKQNTQPFIQENAFEPAVCKMAAMFEVSRHRVIVE